MPKHTHIDFDHWSELASSNPEAFEIKRQEAVNEFIASRPPERQQHLRHLQWRIDGVRRTAGTPLAACIRIHDMMWESVYGPNGLLEVLQSVNPAAIRQQLGGIEKAQQAAVIPFPQRNPKNP